MTKEEIKKVLDLALEYYKLEIFGTGKESQPPTQERIDYIYERMQPSLPSGLDEAAEKILSETFPQLHNGSFLTEREMVKLIKAGAEWVAGQGETIDGDVVKDINNNLAITAKGFSGKEAVFGDKVIVQIRKK
jgi:hypothetical protein